MLKCVRPGLNGQMMPPMIGPVEPPPEPLDPALARRRRTLTSSLFRLRAQTGLFGLVCGLQFPASIAQIVIRSERRRHRSLLVRRLLLLHIARGGQVCDSRFEGHSQSIQLRGNGGKIIHRLHALVCIRTKELVGSQRFAG